MILRLLAFFLISIVSFAAAYPQNGEAKDICPILIGAEMPQANIKNMEGEAVQFHDIIDGKPTLLIVYRGSWCPYCNKHFSQIAKIEAEILEMGFQIIAVSPDKGENLSKTMGKHKLGYSLYSDSKLSLSDALGLSFKVSEKTIKWYKTFGIDLKDSSGEMHERLPVPAVILIDKKGIVQFTYINPIYRERASANLILEAAKSVK